jgi:hypothetical protein
MKQAYQIAQKFNPKFKSQLPANNAKYSLPDDETLVYRYNTKNHLTLELKYSVKSEKYFDACVVDIVERENETIINYLAPYRE